MEILSRNDFIAAIEVEAPGLAPVTSKSPLWIPEKDFEPKIKCITFLKTKRLDLKNEFKEVYWGWCNTVLSGIVRCFSSGDENEWWGFTNPDDIVIWTLKWAK